MLIKKKFRTNEETEAAEEVIEVIRKEVEDEEVQDEEIQDDQEVQDKEFQNQEAKDNDYSDSYFSSENKEHSYKELKKYKKKITNNVLFFCEIFRKYKLIF